MTASGDDRVGDDRAAMTASGDDRVGDDGGDERPAMTAWRYRGDDRVAMTASGDDASPRRR
ncbi:MAG: hypothetical protein QM831_37305 [Kofleriaceae bacterium]